MENLEEKMSIANFFCPFGWIVPVFTGVFVVCVWFYKEVIHQKKKKDVEKPKEKVSRPITLSLNSSLKKVFEYVGY